MREPVKSIKRNHAFLAVLAVLALAPAASAYAQVTPAAGYVPPDDTPSFKVGAVIYADYTWTDEPEITDANGNVVDPSTFNVQRAYINVTGNVNHWISYRITPDITKQTLTSGDQTLSDNNSLVFRLKYAFGQFNLDDAWKSKGSWVRFGEQQTPYVDWMEQIYRYRFQGTIGFEREGYLSSSDFGLSTHYNFPGNYGDVHAGYYNGENYATSPDPNDQKAFEIRATVRPAPMVSWLRGLRITGFWVDDTFNRGNPRRRLVGALTYEHKYVTFGAEHLEAREQATNAVAETTSHVSSVWATPKLGKGWELLLRHDWRGLNEDTESERKRNIAGVAYWFKTQSPAQASLLLDWERVENSSVIPPGADEIRYALHSLFSF